MPPYVSIVRIRGPFLFGTTEKLAEETAELRRFNQLRSVTISANLAPVYRVCDGLAFL